MRLFKQISLDGEDDCDLIFSNENESLESTENEDESSSDEIPTISDVNKEIKEMKEFKELEILSRSIKEKKFNVKQAIENVVAKVIERNIFSAD